MLYAPDHAATNHLIAGCDVSCDWIDVACWHPAEDRLRERRFDNTPAGHRSLCEWLSKERVRVRVAVEATGVYSVDVALALYDLEEVDVMVVHPRTLKDYRRAQMQRSKTDEIDARVICDYARRMPFQPWQPPDEEVFELRSLTRRMQVLTQERTRELCRRHAAEKSSRGSTYVLNDIDVNVRHLERHIRRIEEEARKLVRQHAELARAMKPPDFSAWHRRQERPHAPGRVAGDARRPRRAGVGCLRRPGRSAPRLG